VPYSSDFTQWTTKNLSSTSSASSILEGESAFSLTGDGSANAQIQKSAGTLSTGQEVVYLVFEKESADKVSIRILETSTFNEVARCAYTFSTDSLALDAGIEANRRILSEAGPNGGTTVQVQIRYDPTSGTDFSGNGRELRFFCDANGTGSTTTVHHAQIEDAPNASSPIVTQGSPVTRAGDDYTIFEGGQPPWWNPNEGTILVAVRPMIYETSFERILTFQPTDSKLDFVGGDYRFTLQGQDPPSRIGPFTPFGTDKVAFSMSNDSAILSVNGNSSRKSLRPNILDSTSWLLGDNKLVQIQLKDLIYTPRALPESTLNTLTS